MEVPNKMKHMIYLLLFCLSIGLYSCKDYEYEVDDSFSIPDSIALNPINGIKVINDNKILVAGGCENYRKPPTGGGCTGLFATIREISPQESLVSGLAIIDSMGNIKHDFVPPFDHSISVEDYIFLNDNMLFLRCDDILICRVFKIPFYCFVDLKNPELAKSRYYPQKKDEQNVGLDFLGKDPEFSFDFVMDTMIVCNYINSINNQGEIDEIFNIIKSNTTQSKINLVSFGWKEYIWEYFREELYAASNIVGKIPDDQIDDFMNNKMRPIFEYKSKDKIGFPILHGSKCKESLFYVYGTFDHFLEKPCTSGIIRLYKDGQLDTTFNPNGKGFDGSVYDICVQEDGKILCVGYFKSYNGQKCPANIARLNRNGTLDDSFSVSEGFDGIGFLAIQTDSNGNIYLGGTEFDEIGKEKQSILRLKKRK